MQGCGDEHQGHVAQNDTEAVANTSVAAGTKSGERECLPHSRGARLGLRARGAPRRDNVLATGADGLRRSAAPKSMKKITNDDGLATYDWLTRTPRKNLVFGFVFWTDHVLTSVCSRFLSAE